MQDHAQPGIGIRFCRGLRITGPWLNGKTIPVNARFSGIIFYFREIFPQIFKIMLLRTFFLWFLRYPVYTASHWSENGAQLVIWQGRLSKYIITATDNLTATG